MINIIAAIDESQGIGKENSIPWDHPEDLRRFRLLTTNHTIVMGRKTWDSLPKALPGRRNVVITRDPAREFDRYYKGDVNHNLQPVEFYSSILDKNIYDSEFQTSNEIFFIGGSQIYQEALDYADRIFLTRIPGTHQCDTFFPNLPLGFKLVESKKHLSLTYETYTRTG